MGFMNLKLVVMAAKRRLDHDTRIKIAVLREEGYSTTQIANRVKCSQSAVSKTLTRLKETGSVDDRKRSGRPRISNPREDRALVCISLNDRKLTSPQLKREWEETCGVVCSASTIRKRLDGAGLYGRVAKKKPLLTDRHKEIRLKWAQERVYWSLTDWHKIIWSDESKFNLFGSDGRIYVRRRVGEEYLPQCVQQTVKFGGGSVMVWGCISCDGIGPIVTVTGRMNAKDYIDLLSSTLLPYMQSMGPEYIFMDDNAPCHRARSVKTWMASHNLNFMELWPPQSPDLNPIEHVWNILEKKLVEKKNLKELEEKIKEEWLKIPTIKIQNLISSMPSR